MVVYYWYKINKKLNITITNKKHNLHTVIDTYKTHHYIIIPEDWITNWKYKHNYIIL